MKGEIPYCPDGNEGLSIERKLRQISRVILILIEYNEEEFFLDQL